MQKAIKRGSQVVSLGGRLATRTAPNEVEAEGVNIFDIMLANSANEAEAIAAYQKMHTLLDANRPTEITQASAGSIGATQIDDYKLPYSLLGDPNGIFQDRMAGRDGINLFIKNSEGYITHYIGQHGAGGSAQMFLHTFPIELVRDLDYSGGWGTGERMLIPGLTNREYEFLQRCAVDASTGWIYGMDTTDTSSTYGSVLKRFNPTIKDGNDDFIDAEVVDTSWITGNFRMMSDDSDMRDGIFILESQSTTTNTNGVDVETIYIIDRDGNEVATFLPTDIYDYASPMGTDHLGRDLVLIQYKKSVATFENGTKVYEIDRVNNTLIEVEEYTLSQNHLTGRGFINDAGVLRPAIIYTISSGIRNNQLGLGGSPVSGVDQNQMASYLDGSGTLQYKQLGSENLTAISDDDEQFTATPNAEIAIYSHHDPGKNSGTLRGCHTGYICRTGSGPNDSPRIFYAFQGATNTTNISYHSRCHISHKQPNGAIVAVFRGVLDTGSTAHSFVKIFPELLGESDHDALMAGNNPF